MGNFFGTTAANANWQTQIHGQSINIIPQQITQDLSGLGTQVQVTGYVDQGALASMAGPPKERSPLDWLRGEVEETCGLARAA